MIILAFDTAVTGCSVCITDGKASFAEAIETERGQSEALVQLIDDVIKKGGYAYKDIDRIAVTAGPGSFTGVRIGLSTAKALGLALDRPVLGFSTFEVLSARSDRDTLILIDTKRGDYYGQVFCGNGRCETPRIWTEDEAAKRGLRIVKNLIPDAQKLAELAMELKIDDTGYDPDKAPRPVYLRGAEVSQAKRIAPKILK